ncbi:hypothetical protein KI387_020286, partial [Taxus chinensis]
YLGDLGARFDVYRNDELTLEEVKEKKPRGILISPGPGTPHDSGISLQTVVELGPTVPLFGVCMGLQCIGEAFGGIVVRSPYGVMHGKKSLIYYDEKGEDGILAGLSNPFTAGRYHSLVVDEESFPHDELEITARTDDGLIMGVRHKKYRHIQIIFIETCSLFCNRNCDFGEDRKLSIYQETGTDTEVSSGAEFSAPSCIILVQRKHGDELIFQIRQPPGKLEVAETKQTTELGIYKESTRGLCMNVDRQEKKFENGKDNIYASHIEMEKASRELHKHASAKFMQSKEHNASHEEFKTWNCKFQGFGIQFRVRYKDATVSSAAVLLVQRCYGDATVPHHYDKCSHNIITEMNMLTKPPTAANANANDANSATVENHQLKPQAASIGDATPATTEPPRPTGDAISATTAYLPALIVESEFSQRMPPLNSKHDTQISHHIEISTYLIWFQCNLELRIYIL